VLRRSDGVGDGVPARDIALRLVTYNCRPNRIDLRVKAFNALLEDVEPVDPPQQQDDDNDQNRGIHTVARAVLFRSSIAFGRLVGASCEHIAGAAVDRRPLSRYWRF